MFSIPRETGLKSTSSDSSEKDDSSTSRGLDRPGLIGWLAWTMILPITVFLVTYWQQGFVAAGRAGTTMIMPAGWVWLILWGVTVYWASRGHRSRSIAWLILFLVWTAAGNGSVAATALRWVETPIPTTSHPAFEKRGLDEKLDILVTLGGSASWVVEEFPEINADGERLLSAAQVYHAGMTRTIITTGTSTDGIAHPSEIGRELLISLGVPAERIFSIPGVNTKAEMKSLAEFLKSPPAAWRDQVDTPSAPVVGLVTSAFHMPRALRLAATQGLDVVAIPCAYRVDYADRPWKASDWIPTSENQSTIGLALKETIAWILGR